MAKVSGTGSSGNGSAGRSGAVVADAHFRSFFNAVPDAVLVVQANPPQFTVLAASDEYVRVSGRSRDELLGHGLFDLFPDNPADPNASGIRNLTQSFERVIQARTVDSMALQRYDVQGTDGRFEERWWSQTNRPILDEKGEVAWIIHQVAEITDLVRLKERGREQTEIVQQLQQRTEVMEHEVVRRADEIQATNQRLHEAVDQLRRLDEVNAAARARAEAAEQKLMRILESLTDGFFTLDREWRFTYVNRRTEEMFDRPRQSLVGQRLWDAFPTAWESPFGQAYRRAMDAQEKVELEARTSVRERWLHAHAYPSPSGLTVYIHDVTERHRGEDALHESEIRFRAIFNESMDAALLKRPDGSIALANRASAELLGYSEAELTKIDRSAIVDREDSRVEAMLAECQRTGRYRGEITMVRKDGSRFPAEVSTAIFHDEKGNAWASMFIRDITARKAHESERETLLARLKDEKRWLRAVLDTSPLGILLYEPGGHFYFNDRAEKLFGITISGEKGNAEYAHLLLYPDGTPVPTDQLVSTRVLRGGETVLAAEFLVQHPDGTRVPILGSAAPILDEEGRLVGGIGMFQKVSDRMQAEEAVHASERLLSGMFELLPVGIWIADASGKIIRNNPAAERIWGGVRHVGISEYSQYRGWWADTGEPVPMEDWGLARALTKGETSLGQHIRIQCFDGTFKTIMNSAMPLRDEKGAFAGAIVVNEDVTHLKEVEDELRQAIQTRDEILSIVAHDLRNPVSGILVQVESMARHLKDERTVKALDNIRRQSNRMRRLIQDLLDLTKLDTGTFTMQHNRIPAGELLADTIESQQALVAAASLDLELEAPDDLPDLWTDHDRILQVLENLIGNALKFTRSGGQITLGAQPQTGEVLFWVSDTGAGIAREDVPHLFDRFWQATKADRRGAGLGLAIVKGIVEAGGGRIWVETRVGQGSTFYFTVPTAEGPRMEHGAGPTLH